MCDSWVRSVAFLRLRTGCGKSLWWWLLVALHPAVFLCLNSATWKLLHLVITSKCPGGNLGRGLQFCCFAASPTDSTLKYAFLGRSIMTLYGVELHTNTTVATPGPGSTGAGSTGSSSTGSSSTGSSSTGSRLYGPSFPVPCQHFRSSKPNLHYQFRCNEIAEERICWCSNGAEEDGDSIGIVHLDGGEIEGYSLQVCLERVGLGVKFVQASILRSHGARLSESHVTRMWLSQPQWY